MIFPVIKTLSSFSRASLIKITLFNIALAISFISLLVYGFTSLGINYMAIETSWINSLLEWLLGGVLGIAGWFMLPTLIVLISGLFQEHIIYRTEQAFYPERMRKEKPALWPDLLHDLRFTAWAIFLNILILPLYFFGIGFILSILLNSYFLGREFFTTAAGYHLGKPQAQNLLSNNKISAYIGGLMITLLTLTPVVNLLVPVIAVVWMVHVYHGLQKLNSA
ncbi:MAG: hypothetical protein GXP22_11660 [Gammaproteobacteria bacterium]|nr:hypothetical protein [Gammaproteobacteria bacterium]